MKIKNKVVGGMVFAAIVASATAASAQAVRLNIGGVGALGGVGVSALGGGSLANVSVGSVAGTAGLGSGVNANIDIGRFRDPGAPLASPTSTSLGGDTFFSASQTNFSAGGGAGGSGGGGTQFGESGFANASAAAQESRKRVVTTERARKLVKRRIAQVVRRT